MEVIELKGIMRWRSRFDDGWNESVSTEGAMDRDQMIRRSISEEGGRGCGFTKLRDLSPRPALRGFQLKSNHNH